MSTEPCRRCGAAIRWARNNRTGRPAPIDPEPHPDGNIVLDGDEYRVVRPDRDLFTDPGTPLHLNHFVTCPNPPGRRP
jgi:hypothetical protein